MRHALLLVATAVAGSLAVPSAGAETIVGFNDVFAPAQWTTTVTGTVIGNAANPGSATVTATQLTLVGGNAPSPNPAADAPACVGGFYQTLGPCQVSITTTSILNPFRFAWSYTTADATGPGGDLFGMLIDGRRVVLSDPGGPVSQRGERVVDATASFGWFLDCTDCIGGAATATVTGFQAGLPGQVPSPATVALLGIGIAGLGMTRRARTG